MASWNLTTEAKAIAKAGAGANSTIVGTAATLAAWSDDVEGMINAMTRVDWITNAPSTNFAGFLSDLASTAVAMLIINYDMGGYTSRVEAQTMLDVLDNDFDKKMTALKEKVIQEKVHPLLLF